MKQKFDPRKGLPAPAMLSSVQTSAPELRVKIGVPSMGTWHTDFALSLMQMMLWTQANPVPGFSRQRLQVMSTKGSILSKSRWHMLRDALKEGATHLLYIDSDHTFPVDTLHRLAKARKEVVACNLATKTIPALPTARRAPLGPHEQKFGEPVYSDPHDHGLQKIWRIGTGIMLIDLSIFKRVSVENLFNVVWREDQQDYQGEDWSMATAFDEAGVEMYIDHDLSKQCGHIGFFTYTHEHMGVVVQQEIANG